MKYNCNIISNEILKNRQSSRRVLSTLIITILICLLEFIAGVVANSFALIADAGHMLTDSTSIFICYFAALIAKREADSKRTYGYFRMEILASLTNGVLLLMFSVFVVYSGIKRYFLPVEINGVIMLIVSAIGLVANLIGIILLKGHIHHLNIRGAFLHICSDTISSIGVIIGSLLIIFFRLYIVDTLLSTLIGILIFYNAIIFVKEAVDILMEAAPPHINITSIINDIKSSVANVKDVHDVHIWSISSGIYVLSLHIITDVESIDGTDAIIRGATELVRKHYGIEHLTVQIESVRFKGC